MKDIFFGLFATILVSSFSFGQNTTIQQNLTDYTNASLKNDIEIVTKLYANKDLKLEKSFQDKLTNCKTETELNNLLINNNIKNSNELILLIKKGEDLTNDFRKQNPNFYNTDEDKRLKMFNESFETSFNNSDFKDVIANNSTTRGCYGQWQVAVSRCNRNFAITGAGAVIAAGLTGGIGGLIGGAIACTNLWFCKSDALDDYNSCITE
ncbi:hypothetical protein [Flavobacterium sp.]|uniref:hypothetical protein n=1 Tax=Flavobacterium sp. TaxID=239 RepID=UPI003750B5FB